MSLEQKGKKIKYFFQFTVIVEILFFSYYMHLISSLKQDKIPIKINHGIFTINFDKYEPLGLTNEVKNFHIAASKGGSKYYYSHCSGLSRIKSENLVYFVTELEAETAGYELAKNCKK